MKKVLKMLYAFILFICLSGCAEHENSEKENGKTDRQKVCYIDYGDANSFEKSLNKGAKVKGKIVRFDVVEYKPTSSLGINCWSGEHLNFISKSKLDVEKGDIIIGRIKKEPTNILDSWSIPYEVIEINPTFKIKIKNNKDDSKKEKTSKNKVNSKKNTVLSSKNDEQNLNVTNCKDLEEILSKKSELDPSYEKFASKYEGKNIEFDGRIDYVCNYEYSVGSDILLSVGNYNPDHQIGPTFKFENVDVSDAKFDRTLNVGDNVKIVAKVKKYNSNSGLFYLEPVSITHR